MVFQNYALYPHMTVYDNMAFGLKLRKLAKEEIDRRVREAAKHPRPRGVPRAQAEGALRRAASARGDGTRDRARAEGVPDGRAALEPRREAPRPDAIGDRADPTRALHDHALRHARPGRGDDDGRPRRGDPQGRPPAGRRAAVPLRPSEQPVRRGLHRLAGDEHGRGDPRAIERIVHDRVRRLSARGPRRRARVSSGAEGATRASRSIVGIRPEDMEDAALGAGCAGGSPDHARPCSSARRSGPTCSCTS